jgi:phosphoribosylamine--glycine ligase
MIISKQLQFQYFIKFRTVQKLWKKLYCFHIPPPLDWGQRHVNRLSAMQDEVMETILKPSIAGMAKEGRPFKGVLYVGLMLTPKGIKVLEYNARFGDPETQVILPRLRTDLMDIFEAVADEKLSDVTIEWDDNAAVCVVMASGGYPKKYETGKLISGLDKAESIAGVKVYHAGTK